MQVEHIPVPLNLHSTVLTSTIRKHSLAQDNVVQGKEAGTTRLHPPRSQLQSKRRSLQQQLGK